MKFGLFGVILLLIGVYPLFATELYQCRGEDNVLYFTDDISTLPEKERLKCTRIKAEAFHNTAGEKKQSVKNGIKEDSRSNPDSENAHGDNREHELMALEKMSVHLNALSEKIHAEKKRLREMKENLDKNDLNAVNAYNKKVRALNDMGRNYQIEAAEYQKRVKQYSK